MCVSIVGLDIEFFYKKNVFLVLDFYIKAIVSNN